MTANEADKRIVRAWRGYRYLAGPFALDAAVEAAKVRVRRVIDRIQARCTHCYNSSVSAVALTYSAFSRLTYYCEFGCAKRFSYEDARRLRSLVHHQPSPYSS